MLGLVALSSLFPLDFPCAWLLLCSEPSLHIGVGSPGPGGMLLVLPPHCGSLGIRMSPALSLLQGAALSVASWRELTVWCCAGQEPGSGWWFHRGSSAFLV